MTFNIITIFPNIFNSYFSESIIKRAQNKKIIGIKTHDLRQWAKGHHKTVDNKPYGGGAGMVLMAEPIMSAVAEIKLKIAKNKSQKNSPPRAEKFKAPKTKTILLSAKGKKWTQRIARRYAKLDNVILICGRYEGVDERVKKLVDEEISVGEYVLTGGEIPAMVIVDSITRLLPGVLGNEESAINESHSMPGALEHPHYTRPEVIKIKNKNYKVPNVLLSGNHAEIEKWRSKKSKRI